MSRPRASMLLLLATLLVPAATWAASEPEAETSSGVTSDAGVSAVADTDGAEAAEAESLLAERARRRALRAEEDAAMVRTGRFFATMGGALGGGAALGFVGFWGGVAASCLGGGGGYCALNGILTAGLGVAVGVPLGAWVVGHLLDGDGHFAAVLGGAVVGGLLGYGAMTLGNMTFSQPVQMAGTGLLFLLPLVGASLGYELTSVVRRSALGKDVTAQLLAGPSARGDGAMVGLALRFP